MKHYIQGDVIVLKLDVLKNIVNVIMLVQDVPGFVDA